MHIGKNDSFSTRSIVMVSSYASAVAYVIKRGLGRGYVPIESAAVRSDILWEGGEIASITPFFWVDHIPRIRGAAKYGAEKVINEELRRTRTEFRPVTAYRLRDVTLLDGSVYSAGYRHELRPLGHKARIGLGSDGPVADIDMAALVATCAGSTWWGHWLEDEVPLQMLGEKLGAPVSHVRQEYRDESAYRSAIGIAEPLRLGIAHFKELVVVDEFAQNPDKTRRFLAIRQRLKKSRQGHDRIFLSRGNSGARRVLVNEQEIRSRLKEEGFVDIDVSESSAEEIMVACRGASVVVSVEGSHLAPLLYLMHDFGVLVILCPPYQVHCTVAEIGVFCGLSSGMFICEPDGDSRSDFRASPEELVRFIDDAEKFGVNNRPKLEAFLEKVTSMGLPSGSY